MEQLFINIAQQVPTLITLIHRTAALLGFLLVFRALLKLKIYGEMRTMMAPQGRLGHIVLLLFVGVLLLYLGTATENILMDALFRNPAVAIPEMSYGESQPLSADILLAAKWIIRLVGYISLFRGILQIGFYQEGGRHSMTKSITHIIAGICAINIQQTFNLLSSINPQIYSP
jgi:hypothetical protein